MDDISSLFVEYPDIFFIYEELRRYSELIAVPICEVPDEFELNPLLDPSYPCLMNIHLVLQVIVTFLSCLSSKFLFAMMKKHR